MVKRKSYSLRFIVFWRKFIYIYKYKCIFIQTKLILTDISVLQSINSKHREKRKEKFLYDAMIILIFKINSTLKLNISIQYRRYHKSFY